MALQKTLRRLELAASNNISLVEIYFWGCKMWSFYLADEFTFIHVTELSNYLSRVYDDLYVVNFLPLLFWLGNRRGGI